MAETTSSSVTPRNNPVSHAFGIFHFQPKHQPLVQSAWQFLPSTERISRALLTKQYEWQVSVHQTAKCRLSVIPALFSTTVPVRILRLKWFLICISDPYPMTKQAVYLIWSHSSCRNNSFHSPTSCSLCQPHTLPHCEFQSHQGVGVFPLPKRTTLQGSGHALLPVSSTAVGSFRHPPSTKSAPGDWCQPRPWSS